MKSFIVAAVGLSVAVASGVAAAQDTPKDAAPAANGLKDLRAKASYGIGIGLGRNLKAKGIDVDPDMIGQGVKDAVKGAKPLLTDAQLEQVMQEFQQQMVARELSAVDKNKAEGAAFLAANKAKPGVVTLPSGLQYKVLKAGAGAIPKDTDEVTTNYRGTLIDGTEFDSSYKRNQPATFAVNGVIAGWTEALQLMKTGSKWQLFVPSDLAYGAHPRPGGPIGPNAVLIFEIELISVQPGQGGVGR